MAKNLTLDEIKDECSLSCEITCDFEQGGNLTNTVGGEGGGFTSEAIVAI